MNPSSRAGAESTEDAGQKSGFPYMEGPRLVGAGRFTTENGDAIPHPLS